MKKFKIIQVWTHTETLEIEAENEEHARWLSKDEEFEVNHDDMLYSEEVKEL